MQYLLSRNRCVNCVNASTRKIKQPIYNPIEIYTDASIIRSTMGIGVWSADYNICISRKLQGHIDINRGELAAIFCALVYLRQRPYKRRDVIILSDSMTAIQLIHGEINNDKFQLIVGCIQYLINNWEGTLFLKKVKSHSGIIGNDGADILAKYSLREEITYEIPLIMPDNISTTKSIPELISIVQERNTFER